MTIFRCRPWGSMQSTWWTSTTVPATATTTPSTTLWTRSRRSLCKRLGTWLWRLYDEISARVAEPALRVVGLARPGDTPYTVVRSLTVLPYAALPNKRLKLAGGDLPKASGALVPGRARTVVHFPCADGEVAAA